MTRADLIRAAAIAAAVLGVMTFALWVLADPVEQIRSHY